MTIDLKLHLKPGIPKYRSIAEALKQAIVTGELPPGSKLPTHRLLADQLGVSVQTVSNAYNQAAKMGLIDATIGSGTYVRQRNVNNDLMMVEKRDREGLAIDLSIAQPVCTTRHQVLFNQALHRIADGNTDLLISSMRPVQGQPHHIEVASQWLASQKIHPETDRIILCNGASQALMLALSTALQAGDLVACESLVDHGLIARARILNLRLSGLPTDEQGLQPEGLEALCQQQTVKALYCTPSLCNPTSSLMGQRRREQIAEIVERYGLLLIEDDVYGPLEPDRIPPLSSLLPERAFHVTSLTKIIAPGMRAGFLIAPRHLLRHTIGQLASTNWMAALLPFEIAFHWINDGSLQQLLQFEQQEFCARQKLVDEWLNGYRYQRHPNGMHVWLQLPEQWSPEQMVATAQQSNLLITGDQPFLVDPQQRLNYIRLSLGVENQRTRVIQGLRLLADILASSPPPTHFLL